MCVSGGMGFAAGLSYIHRYGSLEKGACDTYCAEQIVELCSVMHPRLERSAASYLLAMPCGEVTSLPPRWEEVSCFFIYFPAVPPNDAKDEALTPALG